jgi:FkbM family methyltransferase
MWNTNRSLGELRALAVHHGIPWRAARLRSFYRPWVPGGGLAFDIGAWDGHRVRAWRLLGARVVAVEPRSEFARLLHGLYDGDGGVTVVAQGLDGIGDGVSERTLDDGGAATGTVRRPGLPFRGARPAPPAWPTTTLDELVGREGRPDFLRIEFDGGEPRALEGLGESVPALCCAALRPLPARALACVERLQRLGDYRYCVSAGERLRWLENEPLDADGLRQWLERLPADGEAPSGDLYARLA